jgi:hypothetical protein
MCRNRNCRLRTAAGQPGIAGKGGTRRRQEGTLSLRVYVW